jgi:hypothetical protein
MGAASYAAPRLRVRMLREGESAQAAPPRLLGLQSEWRKPTLEDQPIVDVQVDEAGRYAG